MEQCRRVTWSSLSISVDLTAERDISVWLAGCRIQGSWNKQIPSDILFVVTFVVVVWIEWNQSCLSFEEHNVLSHVDWYYAAMGARTNCWPPVTREVGVCGVVNCARGLSGSHKTNITACYWQKTNSTASCGSGDWFGLWCVLVHLALLVSHIRLDSEVWCRHIALPALLKGFTHRAG